MKKVEPSGAIREKIRRMAQPIRMIIHTASGEFIDGGPYEPDPPTDSAFSIVTIPGDSVPNPKLKRYDATATSKVRDASSAEQAAWETTRKDRQADAFLTDKMVLALAQLDWEERSKLLPIVGQTLLNLAGSKARLKTIYCGLLDT